MRSICLGTIVLLSMAAAQPSSSPSLPARVDLKALVDSVVDSSMAAEHIPGVAVVIVQNGRVILSKGYGVAQVETKTPVDPTTTRFRIGSISKMLTALAVTQLVDRGRIGLDDPVSKWVKSVPIENRFSEPVRVRHLLTHTAGFDQLGDAGRVTLKKEERLSITNFLRGGLRTVRPPGRVSSYDTWGITLAGLLVESVSGMPYADYMRKEVFAKAGMTRTDVETPDSLRPTLATGYAYLNDAFVPAEYEYYSTTPASSIDATPEDMGRLMIALLGDGGGVLSHDGARRLGSVQFSNYPGIPAYSYGFFEDAINGQRVLGHGGDMREYESDLNLVPAIGAGVYVVYNHNGEMGGPQTQLRATLKRRLMNAWFPPVAATAPTPLDIDTKRFEGFYATSMYCHTCSEGQGWNFAYHRIRSPARGIVSIDGARWLAVSPTLFVNERNPARKLGFIENTRGEITHSVMGNDARERMDEWLIDEVFGPDWRTAPPPLAARMYRVSENWPRCIASYEAVAAREATNGRNWYYLGYCALQGRDFATSVRASSKAWELNQWQRQTSYQLAAAYAGLGDRDRAFEWLNRSADLQYLTARMLDGDQLLASLKEDSRYSALRARLK